MTYNDVAVRGYGMQETLGVCLVRIQEYEVKEAGPKPHELMRVDLEKKKSRTVARWLKGMEKREYATYFSFWKMYIRFCRIQELDAEVQQKDAELEAGEVRAVETPVKRALGSPK